MAFLRSREPFHQTGLVNEANAAVAFARMKKRLIGSLFATAYSTAGRLVLWNGPVLILLLHCRESCSSWWRSVLGVASMPVLLQRLSVVHVVEMGRKVEEEVLSARSACLMELQPDCGADSSGPHASGSGGDNPSVFWA